MKEIDYNMLSNAEIRIKMKEQEAEYEALKRKLAEGVEKMQWLDNSYNELQQILNKRTKGIF